MVISYRIVKKIENVIDWWFHLLEDKLGLT